MLTNVFPGEATVPSIITKPRIS